MTYREAVNAAIDVHRRRAAAARERTLTPHISEAIRQDLADARRLLAAPRLAEHDPALTRRMLTAMGNSGNAT